MVSMRGVCGYLSYRGILIKQLLTKSKPKSSGLKDSIFFFLAFMIFGREAYLGSIR